jgi:hypothetical protein
VSKPEAKILSLEGLGNAAKFKKISSKEELLQE